MGLVRAIAGWYGTWVVRAWRAARGGSLPRLEALENHPRAIETTSGERLACDREVQVAEITPAPTRRIIAAQLEEQLPVQRAAWRGLARGWSPRCSCECAGNDIALVFPRVLDQHGPAKKTMGRRCLVTQRIDKIGVCVERCERRSVRRVRVNPLKVWQSQRWRELDATWRKRACAVLLEDAREERPRAW